MEINLDTLAYHCNKLGHYVMFGMDTDDKHSNLIITSGKNKNGSRKEFISNKDLMDILLLNHIVGKNSLVEKELKANTRNSDENIELFIYGTLARYILNLFGASAKGEKTFPEIKHLAMHDTYFKN